MRRIDSAFIATAWKPAAGNCQSVSFHTGGKYSLKGNSHIFTIGSEITKESLTLQDMKMMETPHVPSFSSVEIVPTFNLNPGEDTNKGYQWNEVRLYFSIPPTSFHLSSTNA